MFRWLDRHLGDLFEDHGAKLTDTFIGMGARLTIEFANVRLVCSVLCVLSGSGFLANPGLQSLAELGERLRLWTAV